MTRRLLLRVHADTDIRAAVRQVQRELDVDIGAAAAAAAADVVARQAHDLQRELATQRGRAIIERDLRGSNWHVHLTSRPRSWSERLRDALFK